jgi:hypothetical protein
LTNPQTTLRGQGYQVGRTKIADVLKTLGYSLQGNRKTREGKDHPERDAQFEHIAKRVKAYRNGGRPAISVDTRKKYWDIRQITGENIDRRECPWRSTRTDKGLEVNRWLDGANARRAAK